MVQPQAIAIKAQGNYPVAMNYPTGSNTVSQRSRSLPKLSAILILLVIANSSQALETITHDGHAHDRTVVIELSDHASLHDPHHQDVERSDHSMAQDEECVCDEICCASTVDFGSLNTAGASPETDSFRGNLVDNYQSVLLDLFLPPPTS